MIGIIFAVLFVAFIAFQAILIYLYRDVVFPQPTVEEPEEPPVYGTTPHVTRRRGTVDEPNFYKKLEEEYGHIECD